MPNAVLSHLPKPLVLGIETSCDESSLCLFHVGERRCVYEKTLTQVHAHSPYGGVVPDLAARLHLSLLTQILDDVDNVYPGWQTQVGLVAGTTRPGLITSLLVGGVFAKSFANFLEVPFVPIDHCEAHVYSSLIPESGPLCVDISQIESDFPVAALVVSGGHSAWIHIDKVGEGRCVGSTLDDAVGECFDKVARMLGLGYPGGPQIEHLALQGDPTRFPLPVPMPKGLDFSLSGLKTAVRLQIEKLPEITDEIRSDLCASFHHSIDRLFRKKIQTCIDELSPKTVWFSGGVSANQQLRAIIADVCAQNHVICRCVPRKYAGDNASMIAYLGYLKYKSRPDEHWDHDRDIVPHSHFLAKAHESKRSTIYSPKADT